MAVGSPVGLAICDRFSYGLLVGLDVEVDEQNEVAGQESTSENGGGLSASAGAKVGKVREVVGGIVVVCCIRMSDFAILRVFAGLATY